MLKGAMKGSYVQSHSPNKTVGEGGCIWSGKRVLEKSGCCERVWGCSCCLHIEQSQMNMIHKLIEYIVKPVNRTMELSPISSATPTAAKQQRPLLMIEAFGGKKPGCWICCDWQSELNYHKPQAWIAWYAGLTRAPPLLWNKPPGWKPDVSIHHHISLHIPSCILFHGVSARGLRFASKASLPATAWLFQASLTNLGREGLTVT